MPTNLAIDQMTTEDKLLAMEQLWQSLTEVEDRYEAPEWHRHELAEVEKRIAAGEEEFIPWEEAKRNLRKLANEG